MMEQDEEDMDFGDFEDEHDGDKPSSDQPPDDFEAPEFGQFEEEESKKPASPNDDVDDFELDDDAFDDFEF